MDSLGLCMSPNLYTVLQIAKVYSVRKHQSILEIQKISAKGNHWLRVILDCLRSWNVPWKKSTVWIICSREDAPPSVYLRNKWIIYSFSETINLDKWMFTSPSTCRAKVKIYCTCRMPDFIQSCRYPTMVSLMVDHARRLLCNLLGVWLVWSTVEWFKLWRKACK